MVIENATAETRPNVLVIDDSRSILVVVEAYLKDSYSVRMATRGEAGLAIALETPPDLILLDIEMPGMNGHEVCRRLKADPATSDIPVIFLTGLTEEGDETEGFALGAADYIRKPIVEPILMARVKTHLENKQAADLIKNQNAILAEAVKRRTRDLEYAQDVTILALASLVEIRDNETGNHIRRTQRYIKALSEQLKTHPDYSDELTETNIELLYKSAPLHDVGKVGIPDAILQKPGRLDVDEFNVMRGHAALGESAIEMAEVQLGKSAPFLTYAKSIAGFHHEKWDGSGYPHGLVGTQIPLAARLMAVADVYDALISKRVYKSAMSHEQATSLIVEGSGSHFDPAVVDAYLAIQGQFIEIALAFQDTDEKLGVSFAMQKRVLIVEDNPEIQKLFSIALRQIYSIQIASNGEEALEKIASHSPEAIVLDVKLPGEIDGFEICRRIKSNPDTKKIHVVLVTGLNDEAHQEQGFAMGADAYFVKPFSPHALARHLSNVLLRHKGASEPAHDNACTICNLNLLEIDGQHQEWLACIDRLEAWGSAGYSIGGIFSTLEFLHSFSAKHFAYEENLLKELGYPRLEAHQAAHRAFEQKMAEINRTLTENETLPTNLVQVLRNWVVQHINEVDRDYGEWLRHTSQPVSSMTVKEGKMHPF